MRNQELYEMIKTIFHAIECVNLFDYPSYGYICSRTAETKEEAIANLEEAKRQYADLLPLQYWNLIDMLFIRHYISSGEAQTIDEAITLLEKYK